jgi:hypothetical protein
MAYVTRPTCPSLWECWTGHIPRRPLSCDDFAEGPRRRVLTDALKLRYLEFNGATLMRWLIYDLDVEDSFEAWERAMLPAPNLYVRNPHNGHGHLYYALAAPVGLSDKHLWEPIKFAAAVERGMIRRLGADRAYANRFAKNPSHPCWRATWHCGQPYELTCLFGFLDQSEVRPFPKSFGSAGLSRNCDLFDRLRQDAYLAVVPRKEAGDTFNLWLARLTGVASGFNGEFANPLSHSAVRSTAKSVARWTWRKFDTGGFSKIQSMRAKRPRRARLTEKLIAAAKLRGGDAKAIAKALDISERTVRRYSAQPRVDLEENSVERAKPWLVEGISRATWYRRRRHGRDGRDT